MANIIEIKDFSDPLLDVYARLTENQLVCRANLEEGLFIAESPNVIERALDAGYEPVSLLMERKHIEGQAAHIVARCEGLPVYTATLEVLTQLTGFPLTRGVLCAMRRRPLRKAEELLRGKGQFSSSQNSVRRVCVLENIMNPTNLGAIFRSAAALGMDAVLLTHGCADPLYRRAVRVSMGTVFQVPWAYIGEGPSDWPHPGLEILKSQGFQSVAMALDDRAISIEDPRLREAERLAIVLGTEGDGLCERTIADCDFTAKIPMSHGVDSLNVAAASAVAFWQLSR